MNCRGLRFLDLQWSSVTDTGVRALAALSALSHLTLNVCGKDGPLTSDAMQALGALGQLEELSVYGACQTEEHGLKLDFVAGLKSLRELQLDNSRISDAGLAALEGMSHLRELSLVCCTGNFTTSGLRVLRSLTGLQEIAIEMEESVDLQIDDVALTQILVGLRSLQNIHLGYIRVSDASVQTLYAAFPKWTSLFLMSEAMTDVAARSTFSHLLTLLTPSHHHQHLLTPSCITIFSGRSAV